MTWQDYNIGLTLFHTLFFFFSSFCFRGSRMTDATAGIYLGSPPEDPDAILRKIFADRANQQDGLGTILGYCQHKAGKLLD